MSAPWNPGNTTPPAPGIYERDYRNTFVGGHSDAAITLFSRWDGLQWFGGYATRHPTELTRRPVNARVSVLPWREIKPPEMVA